MLHRTNFFSEAEINPAYKVWMIKLFKNYSMNIQLVTNMLMKILESRLSI